MKANNIHCASRENFSIAEARDIVRDLFEPIPWIYWADLLATTAVAWTSFLLVPRLDTWIASILAYAISVVAFYRMVLFTHEVVHIRSHKLPGFSLVWNVICGVPFLIPTLTYAMHVMHHRRKHYATVEDGEYLPFATGSWGLYAMYFAQPFVVPFLAIFRFLVVTPLTWASPTLRDWTIRYASSMVIDPKYCRPLPTSNELRVWRLQEAACFAMLASGAISFSLGTLPSSFPIRIYLTSVGVLMLNAIRTLGAHRYVGRGEEMTFVEQLLDSINFPHRPWLTELWAPVGLRFHALHHLFPSMPYHHLPEAHRRLMAQLPADSPYRQTVSPGLFSAIRQLLAGSPPPTPAPQSLRAA